MVTSEGTKRHKGNIVIDLTHTPIDTHIQSGLDAYVGTEMIVEHRPCHSRRNVVASGVSVQ
jgi:hypothetical protein